MKTQRFIGELIEFVVIALLAFGLFAWIEVRFCIPALERDIE